MLTLDEPPVQRIHCLIITVLVMHILDEPWYSAYIGPYTTVSHFQSCPASHRRTRCTVFTGDASLPLIIGIPIISKVLPFQ